MTRALPVAALAAVLCAASASAQRAAQRSSPLLPEGWRPPSGRTCRLEPAGPLPAAPLLLDEAAAAAALPAGAGHAVAYVTWDTLGAPDSAMYVAGTLEAAPGGAFAAAVRAAARPQTPVASQRTAPNGTRLTRPEVSGLLVRVDAGDPPTVRTGAAEECPPRMRNGTAVRRRYEEWRANLNVPGMYDRDFGTVLKLRLDETGTPVRVEVERGSGFPEFDLMAMRLGREMRFDPAIQNRRPVPVWVTVPVGVEVRSGPPVPALPDPPRP